MKKYLLTTLLLLALVLTLVACGAEEKNDANVETSGNVQAQENVTNEIVKKDDTTTEVSSKDTNTGIEEIVEPDEPVVEMVNFETWATQADNDEVCMVVWNEKAGTQKILIPLPNDETDLEKYSYTIQEGDKFAVPKRTNIVHISINREKHTWDYLSNDKYMELKLKSSELIQVNIICNDRDDAIIYLFNF